MLVIAPNGPASIDSLAPTTTFARSLQAWRSFLARTAPPPTPHAIQIEAAVTDESRWLTLKSALLTHDLVHRSLAQLESRQEQLSSCKPPEPTSPAEHQEACKRLVQWCLSALPVAAQADLATKVEVRPSDSPNEGNAV